MPMRVTMSEDASLRKALATCIIDWPGPPRASAIRTEVECAVVGWDGAALSAGKVTAAGEYVLDLAHAIRALPPLHEGLQPFVQ